jgi:arylsulfatase A-like enzyme
LSIDVSKRQLSITVIRKAVAWVSLIPIGLALGGLAGWLQLQILRYGKLAESQLTVFWATFICTGLVLSLVGGLIGRARLRLRGRILIGGTLVPVAAFLVLLTFNARRTPDVYLLVTDATRADHLSLYGYERDTTPFLEEFAADAVVFGSAISQGTHTIVSTASLLASCYPSQHGIKNYSNVLSDRFKLLPEYLKEHGYATHAYVTNPHLQPTSGYAQGIDKYEYVKAWDETRAAVANQALLAWLNSQAGHTPVFSFMFYIDAHNPYKPPEPWRSRFDPEWEGEPISNWKHKWGRPDPKRLRNLVAQYDGGIAYWDEEFSKLVQELKARGRFDNALIVYTSDHGEEFWEHGFWGHNKEVYDGLVRVPLVVSFPVPLRFPPLPRVSGTVDAVVSGVDVLPTTIAGTTALPQVFGEDDGATRVAYCEEILDQYGPYDIRGVRTRTHKFIRVLNFEGDTSGSEMLFDLIEDPGEQHNLADSDPTTAAAHAQMLDELMLRAAPAEAFEVESTTLDKETLERLKALGYISD